MGLGLDGFRNCKSSPRGSLTGKNPTDRAKLGVKRHILTDGNGIPCNYVDWSERS
ncbi:transposase [Leptospira borgpetersenii]|uniref:Transposase for insertion sequence element IS402 domain protein n=1 Tax=Leptospira borgpetersenii str. Brem 328 TaxID=1049780 RepID=A0ABC9SNN3_LEPBO|nr:transposase [Leptospira borgpetersenii]EMN19240.1 transposase for insertion sequence element IS402 domain protein [Leptospira borgpetersenii str. Brem 328]